MAVLFSGIVPYPAGTHDVGPFQVTIGLTSAKIVFDGTTLPVGVTAVEIFFSFDGGITFPSSTKGTYLRTTARFPNHDLGFSLSVQPTNVKATITAPSAFSSMTTLTVQ